MWLKKKDKVVVLSGKDKGKRGEVLESSGSEKFLVSKLNMVKKHQKARKDEAAGIVEKELPLHQSKLMLVCPRCDTPTSPKMKFLDNGTKVRSCRNCSETIE
jgi:large subunit ribosomal protein L24